MEKLAFPNRITIELTNRCNVSCTFCPRQLVDMPVGDMSEDLYYRIIDEASEHLPVILVFFFRGESLLHPKFMEFLHYAKKKGIGPVQFATNAYAMKHDISDQLVMSGIDYISFSLDTLDAKTYKKTRLEGDLDKSMEHVLYLSEICKRRREEGKTTPTLQISTIEMDDYIDGQKDFVDFWIKHVDTVRVYYEHDDNGRFRNSDVQKQLENELPDRKPCRKVFTDMLIYWNGQLSLCNYDWRGGVKGVNVTDMSLQDAWNHPVYDAIRKMHMDNTFPAEIMCRECQHWRIDYMKNGFLGKAYKGYLS